MSFEEIFKKYARLYCAELDGEDVSQSIKVLEEAKKEFKKLVKASQL